MKRRTVEDLEQSPMFTELKQQIQAELEKLVASQENVRPALEKEREEISEQISGWSQSLANPNLSQPVRATIEQNMAAALQRRQEIDGRLAELNAVGKQAADVVSDEDVVDRLNRLSDVLAGQNPSRTNLELSLHIDKISCRTDGRVIVRTCKLGSLAGSAELLADHQPVATPPAENNGQPYVAKPRRRAIRRVADGGGDQAALNSAAHFAADVDRFANLGPQWFWEDEFHVPRKTCWSKQHAVEVSVP